MDHSKDMKKEVSIVREGIIDVKAIDKNNDGEIDEYREPVILKSLQLGNNNVKDLIDEAMVNQIQSLID